MKQARDHVCPKKSVVIPLLLYLNQSWFGTGATVSFDRIEKYIEEITNSIASPARTCKINAEWYELILRSIRFSFKDIRPFLRKSIMTIHVLISWGRLQMNVFQSSLAQHSRPCPIGICGYSLNACLSSWHSASGKSTLSVWCQWKCEMK
jgi:hypothetical protein